jgi:hypothetical protein
MEHIVPQFIEQEAKIAGPLTFKQLVYLCSGGAITIFSYFFLPFIYAIMIAIFAMGIAIALAFVKINKTSLPVFIKNFVLFLFQPKVYFWKKQVTPIIVYRKNEEIMETEKEKIKTPKMTTKSHLSQLYTRLEIKE